MIQIGLNGLALEITTTLKYFNISRYSYFKNNLEKPLKMVHFCLSAHNEYIRLCVLFLL